MTVLALPGARPDVAVLLVSGDLDAEATDALADATTELISRRRPSLLVHLGRVGSIDGRAVRVLLAARQRAELLGGRVRVVRASVAVRDALGQVGAAHLLQPADRP